MAPHPRFRVHYLALRSTRFGTPEWKTCHYDVVCATPDAAAMHVRNVVEPGTRVIIGKIKILRMERMGVK